jgi:hypothetical protein
MAKTRKLTVEVLGDVKGLRSSFKQAAAETQTLGQSIEGFAKKALLPATAALTALSAGAVKAVRSAADFDETINKVGVVFGDATDQILKFSEGSAQALGQSQQQALNAASSFALFGKSAGLTGNELVGFSTELVKLATDLASIQNTTVDEAIQAIGSGLRGEAEPLRRFNILLDDFTLRQEAVRMGLISTTKQALTPQQKVLASHAVIVRQGSYAMDDFINTSDGLANQQKILSAELSDVTRQIGERLLPFALRLVEMFRGMVKFVADNSGVFFTLGVVIAGVATAVIAINAAYKVYSAVALATKAINGLLKTSFTQLQVSMGIVAGALAAAGFLYTIVKGKKDDYKGSTDQLTAALKLEADAQREAIGELINTDKKFRELVKAAKAAGFSVDDVTDAIENGGPAYDLLTNKLMAMVEQQGTVWSNGLRVVDTLKGMRKEVLRTGQAYELAGSQIRSSAANFRRFEEASWAAMQGATAATTEGVSRIGGGISKLRQNIDNFRDSFSTIRDAARDNLAKARAEFESFAKSVADSLRSGFNFRQAFDDAQARGGSFLGALQEQARKVRDFSVLVNRLVAAGASEAVVQQVLGAGTEAGSAIANEILSTAGGVGTANRLAAEVSSLADTVGQNAAGSFRQAGVDTATALVAGIESVLKKYTIKLKSKGLTQKQLDRLKRNFGTEVNFQFSTAQAEIPALADGGVVASPTLALIGEAGPEAVIPLDRMGSMGGGGDTYVTINVSGGDPQAVVNALVRWSRANGALPSTIRVS